MAQYPDDDDRLIGCAELRRLAGGISEATSHKWVQVGTLPKPTYIRGRRYWKEREIRERLGLRSA
jgi:predicted DNA-binding transcriptional regulator AlpA